MSEKKLIDEYVQFAEIEFNEGNISEDMLNRIRLQMAAEFITDHQDEESALMLVNKVPEAYYVETLELDMIADQFFAVNMLELSSYLEKLGVTFFGTVKTNQPLAEA